MINQKLIFCLQSFVEKKWPHSKEIKDNISSELPFPKEDIHLLDGPQRKSKFNPFKNVLEKFSGLAR